MSPFDISRYPPDWKEISQRVKERAGWRCQCEGECGRSHGGRCQAHHGDDFYPSGKPRKRPVTLTTAHLDHATSGTDESRMRAMCEACHLRYDADHHRRNASATRARRVADGTLPLFAENI